MLNRNKCSNCSKSLDRCRVFYHIYIGDTLIGIYCSKCIQSVTKQHEDADNDIKVERKNKNA